jgi:AhpD family alkylhydroperoxidase
VASEARLQISKVPLEKAEPVARATLESAQQKLGMIPNMYSYMANAPGLLETYRFGYDLFRQASGFTPVEQEVIFLSISYENGCEYCMAAHSFLADVQSKFPAK